MIKVKNMFKSAYSVNVLKHIKDHLVSLRNMYILLEQFGKVVLLVPAKKSAHTEIDKQLGHFRRYEKKELRDKLRKAGFKNIKIGNFNILGLLGWFVRREKIDEDNSTLKPLHEKLLTGLCQS